YCSTLLRPPPPLAPHLSPYTTLFRSHLSDIHTTEHVVERGGVRLFAKLLVSSSAQLRKYAVLVLAQLAISTRGQVEILEEGLLRSEEHTSELQSRVDLVCRLLLEKKK